MAEYKTVEEAMRAVDLAVEDTLADNPDLKDQEDTIYHDMVKAIAMQCSVSIAKELCRRTGVDFSEA